MTMKGMERKIGRNYWPRKDKLKPVSHSVPFVIKREQSSKTTTPGWYECLTIPQYWNNKLEEKKKMQAIIHAEELKEREETAEEKISNDNEDYMSSTQRILPSVIWPNSPNTGFHYYKYDFVLLKLLPGENKYSHWNPNCLQTLIIQKNQKKTLY